MGGDGYGGAAVSWATPDGVRTGGGCETQPGLISSRTKGRPLRMGWARAFALFLRVLQPNGEGPRLQHITTLFSPASLLAPPPRLRDAKAQQEPDRRSQYTRHYAFKGRGRKEFLRSDMKNDANELVPTRGAAGL